MAKNRKHGTEFKLQIINDNLKGYSINSLSRKWDISTSVIRKWIDHHRSDGEKGLTGKRNLICLYSNINKNIPEIAIK
jgi:transposase-like protein